MKKLLLLLMAFLLFAPPRVSAKVGDEKKLTFIDTRSGGKYGFWCTNSRLTSNQNSDPVYPQAANLFVKYQAAGGESWEEIPGNNSTLTSKTNIGAFMYNAAVGDKGKVTNSIMKENGLYVPPTAPITVESTLDYLPPTNKPIILTGTTNGTQGNLSIFYSPTSTTQGYFNIYGTSSFSTGSFLTISIENGWIKAVDIVANNLSAFVAGEGTKSATAETNYTYRFEADDDSRTIQIKNTDQYAVQVTKMVITFVEGIPPAPATPTADLFQAAQQTNNYDADNKLLTFINQPSSGLLKILNYTNIQNGNTIKDATGIAYTLGNADIPDATAIITTPDKNSDPTTSWISVNKLSGRSEDGKIVYDGYIGVPDSYLPTDDELDDWAKKIRFISYRTDAVSTEDLTINLKMSRIDPPYVIADKTNTLSTASYPQTFNPVTNEVTYEKGNPWVYFQTKGKAASGNASLYDLYWAVDDVINTDNKGFNSGDNTLYLSKNNYKPGDDPVKNGTTNKFQVRAAIQTYGLNAKGESTKSSKVYTDTNKGDWYVVTARSVSKNFSSEPAPAIEVTGSTIDLEGGAKGYVTLPKINPTSSFGGTGAMLYQTSADFAQAPVSYAENSSSWKALSRIGEDVTDGFTGRIFFQQLVDENSKEFSGYSYIDLYKIESTGLTDISYATLTSADAPIANGSVVTVAGPLYVRGAYVSTNQSAAGYDSYILFVTDKNGNALRINGEYKSGTGFEDIIDSADKNLVLASVTGVLKGQDKGYPELYLTDTRDYTPLLGKPTTGTEAAPAPAETFAFDKADFSKQMLFTNFTYMGDERFADKDGNLVKIYH
ncbi:MAG: hypothetical protein K2H84_00030, partial [Paramuribaculum sp.]|nr:hypothetical protein [Paramuribaculum sp.]